jgi:hypothetical protein
MGIENDVEPVRAATQAAHEQNRQGFGFVRPAR